MVCLFIYLLIDLFIYCIVKFVVFPSISWFTCFLLYCFKLACGSKRKHQAGPGVLGSSFFLNLPNQGFLGVTGIFDP